MKKLTLFCLAVISTAWAYGQCDLDFGSGAVPLQFTFATPATGSDIVNGVNGVSGGVGMTSESFDIWNEATGDCSTGGGLDDITFTFDIIHAFDQYSIDGVKDAFAGSTHQIEQSSSGLAGQIPMGNSSTNESTVGDVRGYKITVTFASHVEVFAGDVTVNMTSVNTAATAHESVAIQFFNELGANYGMLSYDGYYTGTTGATNDGTCTAPAIRANSWSTTGPGVYTASSTSTTDNTTPCTTAQGTDGPNNNRDISAVTDAGLNSTDRVGGFTFIVHLEDVAASLGANPTTTSTSSILTSTLNGISLASNPLPVELISFGAKEKDKEVELNWSTASETNSNYFDVEWSNDGRTYESIGKVNATGISTEMNNYHFMHDAPVNHNNYYRLKIVDLDNFIDYSEVVSVKINNEQTLRIYPNQAANTLSIEKPAGDCMISIYNINGQLIRKIDGLHQSSSQLDVSDLATGHYIISVLYNQQSLTERFVKI